MKLSLRHTLTLSLGSPARAVAHLLLTPSNTPQQRIERWSIDMPGIADAATFRDGYGNRAHLVSQVKPEAEIVVTVSGVVETFDKAGVLGKLDHDTPPALFRRLLPTETVDAELIKGLAGRVDRIAVLHELMDRVHALEAPELATQTQDENEDEGEGGQSQSQGEAEAPADALMGFIRAARGLGIPARHVTGYLLKGEKAKRHAWAEAWDDGLGWIGFDPALAVCPTENHIRVAAGLDAVGTVGVRTVPALTGDAVETIAITAL